MGQPTSIHWDDFIPMARVLGMISSTIGMIHPNHPSCITGLPKRTIGMLVDAKALNIPGQRDVKLNDLAKQILMLLPLLLLLLLLIYVLTT